MQANYQVSKKFWDDNEWARQHYQELVETYPDRFWVAIADRKVISASDSLAEVEKEAWMKTKRKNCPIIFIERSAHVFRS